MLSKDTATKRQCEDPPLVDLSGERVRAQLVEAERVKLLATHAPTGFIVGLLTVGVMSFVLWTVVPLWLLLLWITLMGVLTLPVFVMIWRFHRVTPAPEQIHTWAILFTVGYGLTGLGWGSSGVLLFPSDSLVHQLFLVFVIGGHSAGGMTALSSVPSALTAFLSTMLLPVIMRLCVLGDVVMTAMGLMLFTFGVAMFMIGRHLHAVFTEMLMLRFENVDLIRDLSSAKERAEAASQAKSQFLANMSHELRTPLNGVLGVIEVLSQTRLTGYQQKIVQTAQRSGRALLTIINDLLDLSKIEAGKLALERLDFHLQDILREVVELFAENASQKGLRLTSKVHDAMPPMLRGDPTRLRQILVNLVGNALKFTEQGAVTIEVQSAKLKVQRQDPPLSTLNLEPETVNSCFLEFSVRDTGIGIPVEAQARIFETFSQADESTTRQYGGTGLGLSIAKQLAELLGGAIGVESREGAGARFWFTACFEPVHASVQTVTAPWKKSDSVFERPPRKVLWSLTVLIVEDNLFNQEVTRSLLEMLGCRVVIASNGQLALDLLDRHSYDVVLMDCQMPEMDGVTAAVEIRRRELRAGHGHVLIIALTASAMPGDRERCLAAGMDDYLTKPFTSDELSTLFQRWRPEHTVTRERQPIALLDHSALDLIRGLGKDSSAKVFDSVLRSYLKDAPQLMETLRSAVRHADAERLRRAAHTLKSSSASLGALTLATLCKDLEALSLTEQVSSAVEILPVIETEYQVVQAALSMELRRSE